MTVHGLAHRAKLGLSGGRTALVRRVLARVAPGERAVGAVVSRVVCVLVVALSGIEVGVVVSRVVVVLPRDAAVVRSGRPAEQAVVLFAQTKAFQKKKSAKHTNFRSEKNHSNNNKNRLPLWNCCPCPSCRPCRSSTRLGGRQSACRVFSPSLLVRLRPVT